MKLSTVKELSEFLDHFAADTPVFGHEPPFDGVAIHVQQDGKLLITSPPGDYKKMKSGR